MAIIQQPDDDKNKQQGGQGLQSSSQGTFIGGSTTPVNTQQNAPKAPIQSGGVSGKLPNLRKFIQANQNVNYGQQLTQGVQQKAGQVQSQIGAAGQTLQQRASDDLSRIRGREQIVGTALADPTKAVSDQGLLSNFTKLRTGQVGTYNVGNIQDLTKEAQRIQDLGGLAKSESGRVQLFRNLYARPDYTSGQARLDQALLRGSQLRDLMKGTAGTAEQTQQSLKNLYTTESELNKELQEGSKAGLSLVQQKLLSEEEGALPAFQKGINQRVEAARAGIRAKQDALVSKMQRGEDLSDEDLKTLGISGTQDADVFKSYYDRSRGEQLAQKLRGEAIRGPTEIDFSKYINKADLERINAQNVASQEDYAKYGALTKLAGQDLTWLRDPSLAGKMPTDIAKYNMKNALIDALAKYSPKTYGEYESAVKAENERVAQAKNTLDLMRRIARGMTPTGAALEADKALTGGKLAGTPVVGSALQKTTDAMAAPALVPLSGIEAGITTEGTATDKIGAAAGAMGATSKQIGTSPATFVSQDIVAPIAGDRAAAGANLLASPMTTPVNLAADTATGSVQNITTGLEGARQGNLGDASLLLTGVPLAGAQAGINAEEQLIQNLSKATGIKEIDDANAELVRMSREEPQRFRDTLNQLAKGDIQGAGQSTQGMVSAPYDAGAAALDKLLGRSVFSAPTKVVDINPFAAKLMGENTTVADVMSGKAITSSAQNILSGAVGGAAQSAFNKAVDAFRPRGGGGGGGGGGCFIAGTLVEMEDGSKISIENVDLGDYLKYGGKVFATGKMIVDSVYSYKGTIVSGTHAVLEDGKWIRVQDSPEAKIKAEGEIIVYPIATQNHLMYVNDIFFADYAETDQGTNVTDQDRLDYLNRNVDLNYYLTEIQNAKK